MTAEIVRAAAEPRRIVPPLELSRFQLPSLRFIDLVTYNDVGSAKLPTYSSSPKAQREFTGKTKPKVLAITDDTLFIASTASGVASLQVSLASVSEIYLQRTSDDFEDHDVLIFAASTSSAPPQVLSFSKPVDAQSANPNLPLDLAETHSNCMTNVLRYYCPSSTCRMYRVAPDEPDVFTTIAMLPTHGLTAKKKPPESSLRLRHALRSNPPSVAPYYAGDSAEPYRQRIHALYRRHAPEKSAQVAEAVEEALLAYEGREEELVAVFVDRLGPEEEEEKVVLEEYGEKLGDEDEESNRVVEERQTQEEDVVQGCEGGNDDDDVNLGATCDEEQQGEARHEATAAGLQGSGDDAIRKLVNDAVLAELLALREEVAHLRSKETQAAVQELLEHESSDGQGGTPEGYISAENFPVAHDKDSEYDDDDVADGLDDDEVHPSRNLGLNVDGSSSLRRIVCDAGVAVPQLQSPPRESQRSLFRRDEDSSASPRQQEEQKSKVAVGAAPTSAEISRIGSALDSFQVAYQDLCRHHDSAAGDEGVSLRQVGDAFRTIHDIVTPYRQRPSQQQRIGKAETTPHGPSFMGPASISSSDGCCWVTVDFGEVNSSLNPSETRKYRRLLCERPTSTSNEFGYLPSSDLWFCTRVEHATNTGGFCVPFSSICSATLLDGQPLLTDALDFTSPRQPVHLAHKTQILVVTLQRMHRVCVQFESDAEGKIAKAWLLKLRHWLLSRRELAQTPS